MGLSAPLCAKTKHNFPFFYFFFSCGITLKIHSHQLVGLVFNLSCCFWDSILKIGVSLNTIYCLREHKEVKKCLSFFFFQKRGSCKNYQAPLSHKFTCPPKLFVIPSPSITNINTSIIAMWCTIQQLHPKDVSHF